MTGRPFAFLAVDDFVKAFKALTNSPHPTLVSVIAAPAQPYDVVADAEGRPTLAPSCTSSSGGGATPAIRLKAFADAFGGRGAFHEICGEGWAPALDGVAKEIGKAQRAYCLDAPLVDLDPTSPGLQPDCSVVQETALPGAAMQALSLPACGASVSRPCWSVPENVRDCTSSGFEVHLDRGGCDAPADSAVVVECATCATDDDPRCPRP